MTVYAKWPFDERGRLPEYARPPALALAMCVGPSGVRSSLKRSSAFARASLGARRTRHDSAQPGELAGVCKAQTAGPRLPSLRLLKEDFCLGGGTVSCVPRSDTPPRQDGVKPPKDAVKRT